jgi:hypothetical protein
MVPKTLVRLFGSIKRDSSTFCPGDIRRYLRPLDWNCNQTEFIKLLLSVDLDIGPIDPKFFASPLLGPIARQLGFPPSTYGSFADDRTQYLVHSRLRHLANWLTGEHCPEEAIL